MVTTRELDPDIARLTRIYTSYTDTTTTEFQDLSYTYDPVGNPVSITDNLTTSSYKANQIIPNTRTFRYDPRYRLVGATGKKHATVVSKGDQIEIPSPDPGDYDAYDYTYSYDEVGNLTRNDEYAATLNYKSGRIDLFNGDSTEAGSFTAPDEGNFQYDENGNTLKTPRLPALAYTHDNQCRWVKLNGGGDAVRYLRHGDQRVLRFVSKGAVRAVGVYLGPFEVHSRDGGSGGTSYGKVVLHVHGHGRHAQLEQVLSGSDPDSVDVFYHHSDHLGSGHVLTDEAGELLSQEEYFPYGRASDRRDARNRYRYIGVERDEDTGMCVTGPRMYDPVMGRFLEGDPIAAKRPALSAFCYSGGSPVGRKDANGYQDTLPVDTTPSQPAAPEAATPYTLEQAQAALKDLDTALLDETRLARLGVTAAEAQELKDVSATIKRYAEEGKAIVKDAKVLDDGRQLSGVYDRKTDTFIFYGAPTLETLVHEGAHALQNSTEAEAVMADNLGDQEGALPLVRVAGMAAEVRLEAQAARIEGVARAILYDSPLTLQQVRLDPLQYPTDVKTAEMAYRFLGAYVRKEFKVPQDEIQRFMNSVAGYARQGTPLTWDALVPLQ